MTSKSKPLSRAAPARWRRLEFGQRQLGQSMVEYTIIVSLAVMVLVVGPGGDVIRELLDVMDENYEGYSYSVSLTPLPDYDAAAQYDAALDAAGYSESLRERLAVDEDDLYASLDTYNSNFDQINTINDVLAGAPDPTDPSTWFSVDFDDVKDAAIAELIGF